MVTLHILIISHSHIFALIIIINRSRLKVNVFTKSPEERVIIFHFKHQEASQRLRSMRTKLQTTIFLIHQIIHNILHDIRITTLINHPQTRNDRIDILSCIDFSITAPSKQRKLFHPISQILRRRQHIKVFIKLCRYNLCLSVVTLCSGSPHILRIQHLAFHHVLKHIITIQLCFNCATALWINMKLIISPRNLIAILIGYISIFFIHMNIYGIFHTIIEPHRIPIVNQFTTRYLRF